MDFDKVVLTRKSVRKYLDKPVEEEKITKCLEAARLAPSWENKQCWRFVVVRDKEIIAKLAKGINFWAKSAPVFIVACGDPKRSGTRYGQNYYLVDVAIAMEHLVLAAANLGLGTCWLGLFDEEETKKLLKIPEGIRVVALTPLGYPHPDEGIWGKVVKAIVSKKRKSLGEIAYDGEWGKPFSGPSKK
jgi:nitroreductase